MIHKKLIRPDRLRQVPPSFNWVDHRLVRDNHINECDCTSLALYLFVNISEIAQSGPQELLQQWYPFSAIAGARARCSGTRSATNWMKDERAPVLSAGRSSGGQRLPRLGALGGLVAAGNFWSDDCRTQLAFGQIVGGGDIGSSSEKTPRLKM